MYTQCPECESVFEISPEHLGAASGMVRCGVCGTTFNALRRLSEEAPIATTPVEAASDDVAQSDVDAPIRPERAADEQATTDSGAVAATEHDQERRADDEGLEKERHPDAEHAVDPEIIADTNQSMSNDPADTDVGDAPSSAAGEVSAPRSPSTGDSTDSIIDDDIDDDVDDDIGDGMIEDLDDQFDEPTYADDTPRFADTPDAQSDAEATTQETAQLAIDETNEESASDTTSDAPSPTRVTEITADADGVINPDDLFSTSMVLDEWDIEEGEQDLEALLADESLLDDGAQTDTVDTEVSADAVSDTEQREGDDPPSSPEPAHATTREDNTDEEEAVDPVTQDAADTIEADDPATQDAADTIDSDDPATQDAADTIEADERDTASEQDGDADATYAKEPDENETDQYAPDEHTEPTPTSRSEDKEFSAKGDQVEDDNHVESSDDPALTESPAEDGDDSNNEIEPESDDAEAAVNREDDPSPDDDAGAMESDDQDLDHVDVDDPNDNEAEREADETEEEEEEEENELDRDFDQEREQDDEQGDLSAPLTDDGDVAHDTPADHDVEDEAAELEQDPSAMDDAAAILVDGADGRFEGDYADDVDDADLKDLGDYLAPKKSVMRRVGESTAVALLLGGLAGQYVHTHRAELATHPKAGDTVQALYSAFGAPIKADWSVSDYRVARHTIVPDGEDPTVLLARATVVNNTEHERPLPLVRLKLNNRWGDAIFGRVFAPEEYLTAPPPDRLAGGGRLEISLDLVHPEQGEEIGYNFDICLETADGPDCGPEDVFAP
ncbi:MAG: DUF3426 domain-containing protein [Pseudomonadota bacterium]